MKKLRLIGFLTVLGAASLYLGGCDGPTKPDDSGKTGPGDWDPVWACPGGVSAGGLDLKNDNLGLESDYVIINFNNGSATVTFSETGVPGEPTIDGEHVSLKVHSYYTLNSIPYNIIVTGTAKNGSLRIEEYSKKGGYRKTLYLNGVNIANPTGPAINIQSSKRTDVHLVGSCERHNILKGKGREDVGDGEDKVQAKGAFFAEGSLVFGGSGSLEVSSAERHAIVSDEFIEVNSGNIIVKESKNDGMHANERIVIKGGTLQIKCEGDAVQNERSDSISVSGGKVTLWTTGVKSHGITSDSGDVNVSGNAEIKITVVGDGSKGIRSSLKTVRIRGGNTNIETYGNIAKSTSDPTDTTSSAAGVKGDGFEMSDGKLNIKSVGDNSKGVNVEHDAKITGGDIHIVSAGDGIKTGGNLNISGGTVYAESTKKKGVDCKGTATGTGGPNVTIKNGGGTGY